jgi:hypothetical protein
MQNRLAYCELSLTGYEAEGGKVNPEQGKIERSRMAV